MKNLTLFLAITTLFFSCKKEEKPLENKVVQTKPKITINPKTEDFLGSWFPQSLDSDYDSIEIDKKTLHLYYSQGEIGLNYEVIANEMILTYNFADLKIYSDFDDCQGKKVGKFYNDNLGNLILDINTDGLSCVRIDNGKYTFQRDEIVAIEAIEKAPETNVGFDIFSVSILGFESEIDQTADNSIKNTFSLLDKSDGWGLSNKKIQISSPDKSLKFDLEYCFIEQLRFQENGNIAWKGNSSFQKVSKFDDGNFSLKEFSNDFYGKIQKEIQQKLKLKDTLAEVDYEIAELSYKGKPVLFEPKFILLKITATDLKGIKTIRFLKVEIYEGGC